MCGIAGIIHAQKEREVPAEQLAQMVSLLRHRGPDDEGTFNEPGAALCHTRLAVIDLSARARQPMQSECGRFVLVYNGEVYNYRELRRGLSAEGCVFRSDTDSEVVLQLLARRGVEAIAELEGMFAFGFLDREERQLLLARDRVGIKPLFYAESGSGIAFASEPKVLTPRLRGQAPAPARIAEYLAFRHNAGRECLLPEVHSLLPGHLLLTDGSGLEVRSWWRPSLQAEGDARDTAGIIEAAVQRQLVSDVPVGVFLSGGVDSSLVSHAAAKHLQSVQTFTVGFDEAGWDETELSSQVARTVGAHPHRIELTHEEYVAGLGRAIWYLDAPLNHAHSVHLLRLAEYARRHVTVALTGEGGDELFAGYPRYRLHLAARWLRGLPSPLLGRLAAMCRASNPRLARILDEAARVPAMAAALNAAFLPLPLAGRLAGIEDLEDTLSPRLGLAQGALESGARGIDVLLSLERQTYLVSLLQRMDRMSMARGLECRVPLLDESVVAHARSLPERALITMSDSKKPLREASAALYGPKFAHAPKSGFGVPLNEWLRGSGPLAKLVDRVLEERRTHTRGWFDVKLARKLLGEHREGARDRSEALWGVLNLELWARICVDGEDFETATAG